LIGLRGVVVKSHGSADRLAFFYALQHAYHAVQNDLLGRISSHLQGLAGQEKNI
jgi:phosphate acyltransferase